MQPIVIYKCPSCLPQTVRPSRKQKQSKAFWSKFRDSPQAWIGGDGLYRRQKHTVPHLGEDKSTASTPCIGVMDDGGQARLQLCDATVLSGLRDSWAFGSGACRLGRPAHLELVPLALVTY